MSLSYECSCSTLLCAARRPRWREGSTVGEGCRAAAAPERRRKVRRTAEAGFAADAPDRQCARAQQSLGEQQALLVQILLEASAERLLEDARKIVATKPGVARDLPEAERSFAVVADEGL